MKTVKISHNVVINGQLLKKDQVHKLEDEHADRLFKGEHAAEHKEAAAPDDSKKETGNGQGDGSKKDPAKK